MSLKLGSFIPISVRFILLSTLGFALMSACVKYISVKGIPLFEIVAARSLVSLVISYITVKHKNISIWGNNKPLLITRGFTGTLALICVYYSVATLPLAESTILQYVHPAFTILLGVIFLKEQLQTSTIVCVVLCLVGVLLITQTTPSQSTDTLPILSVTLALLGAFGSSVSYVIVRKLSQTEDSSVIIFYFPLVALPISIFYIWDEFILPSLFITSMLFLVGIFTQLGQYGLTKAMQIQEAGKTSAYSYIQIIFSILLGVWFFQETPSIWTFLGGGLIVAGALFNLFGNFMFLKKATKAS